MNIKSTIEILEDLIEIQERGSLCLETKIEKYKQRLAVLDGDFHYFEETPYGGSPLWLHI